MPISEDLSEVVGRTVSGNGVWHAELLPAINDDHGGVIVEMEEHMDTETFLTMLRTSMLQWKQQGKKGVWIKLPIGLAHLVETAVKTPSTIPANATHRVGVGAIILNDKREVLVVQEKSGILQGTGLWKIPTGVVEEGEDISVAAIREVKEETGIETEFVEVLGFRQSHKTFFEKSDMFFICMLHPLSFDIQKQELEIEAAQWMPFEEYAAQPFAQKHELFRRINELCLAKVDRSYAGFSLQLVSNFSDQPSFLYLNSKDLGKSRSGINP
ncbi:nudix hydrolase 10-like isoform X2 [Hibiscus syriacus]|uniref:nudix hydrolase 10-like isoform X2 n=1 Tax=Hibiscus syriacus TaxID=106335 RepID=UPI0019236834|nr:nudix hydrolase 10-like isoform X2 [Hibiscus syriacus]